MRTELANLNHCAVPYLSRAAASATILLCNHISYMLQTSAILPS